MCYLQIMNEAEKILHLTESQLQSIEGFVFDCDGTLADSMPPHFRAWAAISSEYGFDFDEDRFYALGGWPTHKVAALLISETGVDHDIKAISDKKEALFVDLMHTVRPIEPMVELVKRLHGVRPMAVATGGIPSLCYPLLKQIGIFECFDAIVTSLDVEHGKPAPDIFLEAARRIGADPTKCMAYEDVDPGIIAAKAAGMNVIDVRQFYQPERITPPKSM